MPSTQRAALFYELVQRDYFFLYIPELGMTVPEFITENRMKLTNMKKEILRDYKLELTDLSEINAAIRDYLNLKGLRDPIPGTGVDWSDREIRLEKWKCREG